MKVGRKEKEAGNGSEKKEKTQRKVTPVRKKGNVERTGGN
jgi:hypothetical protein